MKGWLYSFFLCIMFAVIWGMLYESQFHEYDSNIAFMFYSFILSIICSLTILFLKIFRTTFIKKHFWPTLIFLILANPISVIAVFFLYLKITRG
jgi:drug/metabolite transporter (DMT)-like permease